MGIFHKNKLVLLLTLESDLSDGWEDQDAHKNPESLRQKALKMGANIIKYSFEKRKSMKMFDQNNDIDSVSYTHLTLPTNREV